MSRPKVTLTLAPQVNEETYFHIDYSWWEKSTLDLKAYLVARLQALGVNDIDLEMDMSEVDLVDNETGEVTRVDGFQYMVQTYFQQLPDDFAQRSSLVDAVFCVLLANANQPMKVHEISQAIGRDPDVVIKTLNGPRIYQGISPLSED